MSSHRTHRVRRGRRRSPALLHVTGVVVLIAVVGTGCGSSAPTGAKKSSSDSTVSRGRPTGPSVAEIARSTHVVIGGNEVAVPTEIGTTPIAPDIDDGQQIIISAAGCLPARLFSTPKVPVTWTNLTDQTQQVIFDYLPVKSPPIAPGGSFSWTSQSSQSIAYHTSSGLHGVDTVNPPFG
jgi:hypothetical protein